MVEVGWSLFEHKTFELLALMQVLWSGMCNGHCRAALSGLQSTVSFAEQLYRLQILVLAVV